jgi:hypothetical protein
MSGPKWLAIHSFRSNPEVFRQQLEEVLAVLGDVEVDFVQAPHSERAPGRYFPATGFEWWSSPTYKSAMMGWLGDVGLEESKKFLVEKVQKDGPYVGVIGFSQGGGMSHFLLGEGLVGKGILFSPVVPLGHCWAPCKGKAVVIHDPQDLTGECYPIGNMKTVEHGENHVVPKLTPQMIEAITEVLN